MQLPVLECARTVLDSVNAPDARRAAQEFVAQVGRDAAFQLEACVHCGQCADACHFHLVTGDPRHVPIYKLWPMLKAYQREAAPFSSLKKALGLAPPEVTAEELHEWSELLYDSCRCYSFEVVQIVELLDRFVREGRLRLRGKDARRLTFHDPCQLVRRGGLTEAPRRLMDGVIANLVEMPGSGAASFYCGGGGAVSAIHRAEGLRFAAFECKKQQIEATGAEALVTACANCRNVLEEAIEHHGMTLPVLGLTELVAQYLEPETSAA